MYLVLKGNIKSVLARKKESAEGFIKTGKTCELSNIPTKNNRIFWHLSNDGDVLTRQAAKWIAITYPDLVENDYFEGALIDHKDRDRMNNHPSNLRWVTHQESLKNRDLS